MKLEVKEMEALTRKVKSFVRHADLKQQRIIYWSLLKQTVVHDWKGVEWLYEELRKFVEGEFEEDNTEGDL